MLILIAAALQSMAAPGGDLLFVPPVPDDRPFALAATAECLPLDHVRATRIIAGTGIVYTVANRRQFINRVRGRASALATGQVMRVRSNGPLLCRGDIVHLVDGLTGASVAFVGLGRFERYDAAMAQRP